MPRKKKKSIPARSGNRIFRHGNFSRHGKHRSGHRVLRRKPCRLITPANPLRPIQGPIKSKNEKEKSLISFISTISHVYHQLSLHPSSILRIFQLTDFAHRDIKIRIFPFKNNKLFFFFYSTFSFILKNN